MQMALDRPLKPVFFPEKQAVNFPFRTLTTSSIDEKGAYRAVFVSCGDPVNWVDLWGLECEKASDKEAATVILNDQEKATLAAGLPIMPIQEGLFSVPKGGDYGPREPVVIDGRVGLPFHNGVDLAAPIGTPVRATFPGEVIKAEKNDPIFGNYIVIQHTPTVQSLYGHLNSMTVEVKDSVVGGQVIGTVGKEGFAEGPHLHYELQDGNGNPKNPHF